MDLAKINKIAVDAVKNLRKTRLSRGDFFMINVNSLEDNLCYLEYPEGVIKLVAYHSDAKNFTVIRELEHEECEHLRAKFDLDPL